MLKIEVIKFEAIDVIATSPADDNNAIVLPDDE